jgi:MFS family permease
LTLIPLSFQQVLSHDALVAGMLVAPQSLGTMLALPYAGKLTDRIGARPVVLAGIVVSALGAVTYTQVSARPPDLVLAASLLLWGMGIAAVAVPVAAASHHGRPPSAIPSATSAVTTVQTVGASVGAAVVAAILQNRSVHHTGVPAVAFADTFWWVLGLTALAAIPALPPITMRDAAASATTATWTLIFHISVVTVATSRVSRTAVRRARRAPPAR